jgi:hypothetical protein
MSIVIKCLQAAYFGLLRTEDYPNTPLVTKHAHELGKRIRSVMAIEARAAKPAKADEGNPT